MPDPVLILVLTSIATGHRVLADYEAAGDLLEEASHRVALCQARNACRYSTVAATAE